MARAISVFTKREGASSITQSAWLRRSVLYLLLLILWQVIALAGIWPDYLFPGPLAVLGALVNGFQNGQFLQASLLSLQRLGIGYARVVPRVEIIDHLSEHETAEAPAHERMVDREHGRFVLTTNDRPAAPFRRSGPSETADAPRGTPARGAARPAPPALCVPGVLRSAASLRAR